MSLKFYQIIAYITIKRITTRKLNRYFLKARVYNLIVIIILYKITKLLSQKSTSLIIKNYKYKIILKLSLTNDMRNHL